MDLEELECLMAASIFGAMLTKPSVYTHSDEVLYSTAIRHAKALRAKYLAVKREK